MSTETLTINESAESTPSLLTASVRGTGRAYGAAGELVSGTTEDGKIFSLSLPLQAVSTVELRIRPAKETIFKGLDGLKATTSVLEYALKELGLSGVDLTAKTKTMISGSRDLNAREADASAALYALYAALELPLEASRAAHLIHSALGAPSGLGAPTFNEMTLLDAVTGERVASFPDFSRLAYAVIRPKKTRSRDGLLPHPDHQEIFEQASLLKDSSPLDIGLLASRSAKASHETDPHDLGDFLLDDGLARLFNAQGLSVPLGVSLSPNSHGACIIFDEPTNGRAAASGASSILRQELGEDYWFGISTSHPKRHS